MGCKKCLGSGFVRRNTISGETIPFLPKRLRDIDREDNYHKTIECLACKNKELGD